MIKVQIYPVTMIETNCCYLRDEATGKTAVSDPGGRSAQLEALIDRDGSAPEYVLITHGHYDHICYARQFAEKYGSKIVTGKNNARFLRDVDLNGTAVHGIPFEPFDADILLEDGETFKLGETEITYLYTPGHTSGCGIFIFDDVIIGGDLIFRTVVEIPRGLNEKQRAAMRAFADSCGESNYTKHKQFFKKIFGTKG